MVSRHCSNRSLLRATARAGGSIIERGWGRIKVSPNPLLCPTNKSKQPAGTVCGVWGTERGDLSKRKIGLQGGGKLRSDTLFGGHLVWERLHVVGVLLSTEL